MPYENSIRTTQKLSLYVNFLGEQKSLLYFATYSLWKTTEKNFGAATENQSLLWTIMLANIYLGLFSPPLISNFLLLIVIHSLKRKLILLSSEWIARKKIQVHIAHDNLMGAVEMESLTSLEGKKKDTTLHFPPLLYTYWQDWNFTVSCL